MPIVNTSLLYPQKFIERVDLMLNIFTTKKKKKTDYIVKGITLQINRI